MQHRLVAGHRALRREHVHRLRARDARHLLERERRDPARRERLDEISARRRRERGNEHTSLGKLRDLLERGRLNAQHDRGCGVQRCGVADDGGACLLENRIGKARGRSRVPFHEQRRARLHQLGDAVGPERDAPLAVGALPGHADVHRSAMRIFTSFIASSSRAASTLPRAATPDKRCRGWAGCAQGIESPSLVMTEASPPAIAAPYFSVARQKLIVMSRDDAVALPDLLVLPEFSGDERARRRRRLALLARHRCTAHRARAVRGRANRCAVAFHRRELELGRARRDLLPAHALLLPRLSVVDHRALLRFRTRAGARHHGTDQSEGGARRAAERPLFRDGLRGHRGRESRSRFSGSISRARRSSFSSSCSTSCDAPRAHGRPARTRRGGVVHARATRVRGHRVSRWPRVHGRFREAARDRGRGDGHAHRVRGRRFGGRDVRRAAHPRDRAEGAHAPSRLSRLARTPGYRRHAPERVRARRPHDASRDRRLDRQVREGAPRRRVVSRPRVAAPRLSSRESGPSAARQAHPRSAGLRALGRRTLRVGELARPRARARDRAHARPP